MLLCTFTIFGKKNQTEIPKIQLAQHGFWVNGKLEHNFMAEKYWIPPSKIDHVECIRFDEDD